MACSSSGVTYEEKAGVLELMTMVMALPQICAEVFESSVANFDMTAFFETLERFIGRISPARRCC